MINGDYTEFINHIHYGDELWFVYKNEKYFLEGLRKDGILMLFLFKMGTEGTQNDWIGKGTKENYPVDEFLEAKIFDGKSFREIQNDVEWVDC